MENWGPRHWKCFVFMTKISYTIYILGVNFKKIIIIRDMKIETVECEYTVAITK